MSELFVLVLFDEDGTTCVLPPSRLDRDPVKSTTCYVKSGCKKLLAEVLEVSENQDEIDDFEDTWIMSHRANHLRQLQKIQKKHGYLSSWPEDIRDLKCQVNKRRKSSAEVTPQNEDTTKKQKTDDNVLKPRLKQVTQQNEDISQKKTKIPIRSSKPASRNQVTQQNEDISQKKTKIPIRSSKPVSRNQVTLVTLVNGVRTKTTETHPTGRHSRASLKKQKTTSRSTGVPIRQKSQSAVVNTVVLPQKNSASAPLLKKTVMQKKASATGYPATVLSFVVAHVLA